MQRHAFWVTRCPFNVLLYKNRTSDHRFKTYPLILTAFYGGIAQTMIAAFVVISGRLLIEANIASSINIFP